MNSELIDKKPGQQSETTKDTRQEWTKEEGVRKGRRSRCVVSIESMKLRGFEEFWSITCTRKGTEGRREGKFKSLMWIRLDLLSQFPICLISKRRLAKIAYHCDRRHDRECRRNRQCEPSSILSDLWRYSRCSVHAPLQGCNIGSMFAWSDSEIECAILRIPLARK